jgi:hypothetical protein
LSRWLAGQEAALRGVRLISMQEQGTYDLEGARGRRSVELTIGLEMPRGAQPIERSIQGMAIDGNPVSHGTSDRGRRYASPLSADLQRATDLLLTPGAALEHMIPADAVERDTISTGPIIGIRARATDESSLITRVVWWLDEATGALAIARAFIADPDGAVLDVTVRYNRVEGLDLPLRRRIEGSMPVRRRVRSYTVLVDSRSTFAAHDIDRRPSGRD